MNFVTVAEVTFSSHFQFSKFSVFQRTRSLAKTETLLSGLM